MEGRYNTEDVKKADEFFKNGDYNAAIEKYRAILRDIRLNILKAYPTSINTIENRLFKSVKKAIIFEESPKAEDIKSWILFTLDKQLSGIKNGVYGILAFFLIMFFIMLIFGLVIMFSIPTTPFGI